MGTWTNRIVGQGEEAPDQLLANPLNFRIHPKAQQAALTGALDTIGWVQQVVVNKQTGHIVDGHLRVSLALRDNQPTIPVLYVDLTEAEEAQALLSLDPIAAMAATDKSKMDELFRAVETDNEQVQKYLSELAEREGLDYGKTPPQDDPGAQVDRAEELRQKWSVETGQLWALGEHRLICGDSLDGSAVAKLLDNNTADLVVTDPPYAIYGSSTGIGGDVTDNNMVRPFMRDVASLVQNVTRLGAHCYIFCDWRSYSTWFEEISKHQLVIHNCIVWDKGDGGLGSMYTMRHEFAVFCEHIEKAISINKATNARRAKVVHGKSNVQRFNVPQNDERLHNAAKPLELLGVFVEASSDPADLVFDPFSGSGTVLIACEQLNRRCRAVEISPGYVAVALERWAQMTGKTPELLP